MSTEKVICNKSDLVNIANSVRTKLGVTDSYYLSQLSGAVDSIPTGIQLPTLINPGAASDLLVGKELIDQNGNVVTGTIPTKTSSDLTSSGATVTVPAGYYASSMSKSVSTATQATPSISINSSGLITASATQSAGYISSGTKSATKQLTTQAAKTITPGTSNQTAVVSGRYTTGAVTVKGDTNLKAENIAQGVSIFGVTGTHQGGSAPSLQSKSVTYASNGTDTIMPDEGYDGLSSVNITVDVASGGGSGAGFKVTFPATATNWDLVGSADLLLLNGGVKSFSSYSNVSGKTIENVVGIHCVGRNSAYVLIMKLSGGSVAQCTIGPDQSSTFLITTSPNRTYAWYYGGDKTFWWPLADIVISKIEMYNTD